MATSGINAQQRRALAILVMVTALVAGLLAYLIFQNANKKDESSKKERERAIPPIATTTSPKATPSLDTTGDPEQFYEGPGTPTLPAAPDDNDNAPKTLAKEFAAAWVRKDLVPSRWQREIVRHCTKKFADEIDSIDPDKIPGEKVVNEPETVYFSRTYTQVRVRLDAGPLTVTMSYTDRGWRVSAADFLRE